MQTFQDRLRLFVDSLGYSMQEFERHCNIKAGTASKMTSKSYSTTFHKIQKTYPQLNMEWLKTGEGEMIQPLSPIDIDIDLKLGGSAQMALGNITNIGDAKAQIILLQERIKAMEEKHKVELASKERELAEKDARIADLQKMNNFLMEKI